MNAQESLYLISCTLRTVKYEIINRRLKIEEVLTKDTISYITIGENQWLVLTKKDSLSLYDDIMLHLKKYDSLLVIAIGMDYRASFEEEKVLKWMQTFIGAEI